MRNFIGGALTGMLVGPLLAVLIMLMGLWPITATTRPPNMESRLARLALDASVAHAAPKVGNPVQASTETLRAGMKIYRENCAGCHGEPQKPSSWGTTSFYPRVPQFADEPSGKSEGQLFWIVKNGIRYSGMGAWDGQISDEKMWQVASFINHLKDLPPEIRSEWLQGARIGLVPEASQTSNAK